LFTAIYAEKSLELAVVLSAVY